MVLCIRLITPLIISTSRVWKLAPHDFTESHFMHVDVPCHYNRFGFGSIISCTLFYAMPTMSTKLGSFDTVSLLLTHDVVMRQ